MFSLTIVFGPGPMVWTFMYKNEETAIAPRNSLQENKHGSETDLELVDDFGQECEIKSSECHGWMLENLEQSRLAHIERALHQARTQAKGSELADADPVLRQARMKSQGGLGMIQPMPGGMMAPNGRFPS
jgi:hypothetical protein